MVATNTTSDAADLWLRFRAEPTDQLRHAIAGMHFGIVLEEAHRHRREFDPDDLVAPFTTAMYRAIDRFDSSRPEPFAAFIRTYMRSKLRDVRGVRQRLSARTRSLNQPVGVNGDAEFGDLVPDDQAADPADRELWAETFNRVTAPLSLWQRTLVRLHVLEHLPFVEIAARYRTSVERATGDTRAALDAIAGAFTVDELHELLGGGGAVIHGKADQARQAAPRSAPAVGHRAAVAAGDSHARGPDRVHDAVLVLDRRHG